MFDTSIEKTKTSLSPNKTDGGLRIKRPKIRNPSVKTTKSKVSNYRKKRSIINIYPKNISFDYSNNNEYNVLNYPNQTNISDNLLKEKNLLIQNLQNQINKYLLKLKECTKKINIQNQTIISLKSQNKQLNNENTRKNKIIKQNEDIDYKISKLRKDAEKSREKILNEDYSESKRNNYILNNKIKNIKKELQEKEESVKNMKLKNDYLVKLIKDNEENLKNKISQINKLNEENISLKQKYNEIQNNFNNLLIQVNNYENFDNNPNQMKQEFNAEFNNIINNKKSEDYKIMEMKIKSCQNEINSKNMNINILTEQNQFLNSLLSQKNEIINNLQKEKINLNKSLSNITSKNMELNKILNQKHGDIIQFQTTLIDQEKIINNLKEYINKLKTSQKNNIKNIKNITDSYNLISDDENEGENKNNNNNSNKNKNQLYEIKEIELKIFNKGINIKKEEKNINKIKELNIIIEKLNKEIKRKDDEYNQNKTQLENYNKFLENKVMQEKNNYNEKIDEYLKNIKSLTNSLSELEQEKKNMEKQINILNKENKKILEEKNDKDEEETLNKIELINENEKKKEEIISLKQQIETLKEKIENKNKDIKDINSDLENKISELNKEINKYKENIDKKDLEIKNMKEENEDNVLKIEELAKKINDDEINIKGLNLENRELKENFKEKEKEINKLNNDIKNLNEEIIGLKDEIQNLKQINQKKENKIKIFDEEKNNLVNNFSEKEKEFNENKLKIIDLEQNLEKINGEKNELNIENEKYKKKFQELNNEINKLNLFLKEGEDNLKLLEEKYNSLKNEKLNSNKNDIENLIEKNNLIIKEKINLENEIKKMNLDHKNVLDEMLLSKGELELKYSETLKENEKLQEKIKQLSILQDNLEEQLNALNIKYKENKMILGEKEKELNDLKEASQAIIMKQKTQIEKEVTIDKEKCKIIKDQKYKNLKWYLIYETNQDENDYGNYRWVTGLIIKDDQLDKYNEYESDSQKIKDLQEYIMNLQKKLEAKEESISKLDYKNKKLVKEIHNKTAGARDVKKDLLHAISGNIKDDKNNTSTEFSNFNDNFFSKLNKGKDQIEDEEKKANLLSQKKVDEFLTTNAGEEADFDEVKQIQNQMKFLKKELKETRNYNDQLTEQVKELIKNVKCDNKNKIYIEQICQILNLSPNTTKKIISNNKKGIKI